MKIGRGGVLVFKAMKIDHFFGVFRRLGNFLHVFWQVKEWLILEVQEMIRVSGAVTCRINFNLLCHHGQGSAHGGEWRGVLKLRCLGHFLKFLVRLTSSLY